MPRTEEVEKTLAPEEQPNKPGKDYVSEEMIEEAKASAEARNVKKEDDRSGLGVLRKRGDSSGAGSPGAEMRDSDIPYPKDIHGDNFEHYGPAGMYAKIPEGTKIEGYSSEQEFMIDPEDVEFLSFDRPGRNLPKKRLYNIKGIHKDGRFGQFGFEPQIGNNAGGDPEDAIGLRRKQRKGIHLLIDWDTLVPVYCAAWGCWAQAEPGGNYVGFCTLRHAQHTLPNAYKGGSEISKGLMESGVTTRNVWAS
jgi:hypothetical protein